MMCGREQGGESSVEYGVCPAAADPSFDGINSGKFGGRICWAVAGTFCGGCTQGSFVDKRPSCLNCDFYQMVQDEEGMSNRQTKFLQFLFQENRSPFFDKMTYRHVKAGERFVVQDAVENTAYIIQQGSCLVIVEKDGELHPVDHYGEGDIIGGLGILTGEPRRAHVEAETDMDLWVMTRDQFDEMTEKDPALMDFITELVADRLDSRRPTAYRTIGKYVATDIIGRGAFSIVYKGKHEGLNRPVVIKMMRHDMAAYPDFIEYFHNEAKTIASLTHDHIVKVYDFEERYRTLFIIMEYLRGDSLKDMICHLRVIPSKLAANFLVQICSALAYAHQSSIVHRDINPSNIIVQPNDHLKIIDFGLACPAGTEDFSNMGTAYYMAPEQIDGRPVDQRTDIYALGITAFEMVTGRRPFPEENAKALLDMHLTQDVMDQGHIIPDIPDELRRFILKCARCDPDQRFHDMDQAMAVLRPLVDKNMARKDVNH
jgi:CRP-like cAMP-binding protein